MDKTAILFFCGLGVGIFVGQLELPSDLTTLDSPFGVGIVAATEIWLIIHYVVALTTLPILAIKLCGIRRIEEINVAKDPIKLLRSICFDRFGFKIN